MCADLERSDRERSEGPKIAVRADTVTDLINMDRISTARTALTGLTRTEGHTILRGVVCGH